MASKFPRYSFNELLDLTPAALNWMLLQAVNLDGDLMAKINVVMGAGPAPQTNKPADQPKTLAEQFCALRGLGLNVRRG